MFKRPIAAALAVALAGCAQEPPVTPVAPKPPGRASAPYCPKKTTCGEMLTCAEAVYHATKCHQYQLDRNGNGVPCEAICGKTQEDMKARLKAAPYSPRRA